MVIRCANCGAKDVPLKIVRERVGDAVQEKRVCAGGCGGDPKIKLIRE